MTETKGSAHSLIPPLEKTSQKGQPSLWNFIIPAAGVVLVAFLAFYNLTNFPTTWFDEGSHLHVPKTLIRYGVYADYSSEGFRHFGPTIGVGPTVLLPIAAAFRVFGIGLLQARVVMVIFLLLSLYIFYRLARQLGSPRFALVASAILVTTRGAALMETGRQVLGEVPGLLFVLLGFLIWFSRWERATNWRLLMAGGAFGLAMITKSQYLLVLAPTLLFAWFANLIYYRSAPQRAFLIPGVVSAFFYLLWQLTLIFYLGPATASENFAMLQEFTGGAALVFDPALMQRALRQLLGFNVYLSLLPVVLMYGVIKILPRNKKSHQWAILLALIAFNLIWFIVASISWLRYAFPGLAISSLFVAGFFEDLTGGFEINFQELRRGLKTGADEWRKQAVRLVLLIWLGAMIFIPLTQTMAQVIAPDYNAPLAMAAYLDENVAQDALIETWEPELGFLTDHNYHFPPPLLLNNAVGYIWLGGRPPSRDYNFVPEAHPDYIIVGEFSRWVDLYSEDLDALDYTLVTQIGAYELYKSSPDLPATGGTP